jgi:hypothetical protein
VAADHGSCVVAAVSVAADADELSPAALLAGEWPHAEQ